MWGRRSFSALPRLFNTPLAAVMSTGAAAACICSDYGPSGYIGSNGKKTLAEEWEEIKARKSLRALRRSYTERIRVVYLTEVSARQRPQVELEPEVPRHFDNPTLLASRVGACSVASNNPNEDRFIRAMIPNDSGVILAGVFDGHGGYHVADFAATYMPAFIRSIVGEQKSFNLGAVLLE
ncbi:hypothetical protein FOZ62_002840, partial [Perkinsus olseni]